MHNVIFYQIRTMFFKFLKISQYAAFLVLLQINVTSRNIIFNHIM